MEFACRQRTTRKGEKVVEDTTGWGYYQQGSEQLQQIDKAGEELSRRIHCPVHYPAWGKGMYECRHGITFLAGTVVGCLSTGNWGVVVKYHRTAWRPKGNQ